MDRKINIAVFISSGLTSGGGFQYELKIASLLNKEIHAYNIKFFTLNLDIVEEYKKCEIDVIQVKKDNLEEILIESYCIDLVYFLNPTMVCLELVNLPYIITVWDLCHRDFLEFPEVRLNHEFEKREKFYAGNGLKKAIAVIVDSKLSQTNLIKRYGLDEKRIHILKFLPRINFYDDVSLDIHKKYGIQNPYVFYPAQFWAHKNHIYILDAIKILKETHSVIIDVVFTGKDYGNLNYILNTAQKYHIEKQIHYLGFVENTEIPSLYKNSLALVMPTYFGPTNIPPLEAFLYEVPVCYSDLDGLRDQVEDAAFLLDLNQPNSLVNSLVEILNDSPSVKEKIAKGKSILNKWTDTDFTDEFLSILNNFEQKRRCWGTSALPGKKLTSFEKKIEKIIELQYTQKEYECIIYGCGTIGKMIYSFMHQNCIAFIDQKSTNISKEIKKGEVYNPTNLPNMQYDKIIISVLGREEEIIKYLVEEVKIDKDKIITLEL
ncbi:MAG: glycosyltransferase [Sulfurimonadaceae bacterium]